MKRKTRNKVLSSFLTSTLLFSSLVVTPLNEAKVKAAIDEQTTDSATRKSTSKQSVTKKTTSEAQGTTGSDTTDKILGSVAQNIKDKSDTKVSTAFNEALTSQLADKGIDVSKLDFSQKQEQTVKIIVQLEAKPAAENGSVTDNDDPAQMQNAAQNVINSQSAIKQQVATITGQQASESYGYVVNGFSTYAKVADINKIQRLPGVKTVTLAKVYTTNDTYANSIANTSAVWQKYKLKGEGTVVSVIDTGIDYTHKDLRLSSSTKPKLSQDAVNRFIKRVGHGQYFTAKVPYGYNYADHNSQFVYDTNPNEQHGMHVAGIIGANGTGSDPTKSVLGVAPEAQLLAMKVFSNAKSLGATTGSDEIIAAIDDSAKIGADVLNMSLGSASGDQTSQDPEQVAVKNATNGGHTTVIAAGNSGTSNSMTSGNNTSAYDNDDEGTVGTPGTSRTAVTVASSENKKVTGPTATFKDGKTDVLGGKARVQATTSATEAIFSEREYYLAKNAVSGQVAGLGKPEDFDSGVKGKIAIVMRGSLPFTEKQKNAIAAGAAGVIIVNTPENGNPDVMSNFQFDNSVPTLSLTNSAGKKLAAYVKTNPTHKLSTTIETGSVDNPLYGKLSSFSSFGPTPDLSFKPDITAPGGNVWSTQNKDSYASMSGTSMASPFIAGTQALVKQALEQKTNADYSYYKTLKGANLTAFTKAIEMNHAVQMKDPDHDNVIFTPRRQGAGLVDVNATVTAIEKNPTTVVSSSSGDYPAVELKSFSAYKKTFTLKFKNPSNKAHHYTLSDTDKVYTEVTDASGTVYDKPIDGASIDGAKSISIPAKSEKEVSFSVTVPASLTKNSYVEGFLTFKGDDDSQLSIPYLGYYGDWSTEKIFDELNYEDAQSASVTGMSYLMDAKGTPLGATIDQSGNATINKDSIAFGGKTNQEVDGHFYFFRNVNNVKVEILDSEGKVVRQLSNLSNFGKTLYNATTGKFYNLTSSGFNWDGTVYDAATGKNKPASEGQYTYKISATSEIKGAKAQSMTIPVKLDRTKPNLKEVSLEKSGDKYVLTGKVKDNQGGSGIDFAANAGTAVNGVSNVQDPQAISKVGSVDDQGYQKIAVALTEAQTKAVKAGQNVVELEVFDHAGNFADEASLSSGQSGNFSFNLVGLNDGDTVGLKQVKKDKNGQYTLPVTATYPEDVYATYTNAKGKKVTVKLTNDNNKRTTSLSLKDANYDLPITFSTDSEGQKVLEKVTLHVSLVGASFTLENPASDETTESSYEVKGQVSDAKEVASVSVKNDTTGKTVSAKLATDGSFSATVPVKWDSNKLTVSVTDKAGNTTSKTLTVKSSSDASPTEDMIKFDQNVSLGNNQITSATKYYNKADKTITITGTTKHHFQTFEILDPSSKTPVQLNYSGNNFKAVLPAGDFGKYVYTIHIADSLYQIDNYQESIAFYTDAVSPTLTLDNEGQNVYTDQATYKLTGEMKDNYKYFELYVNGNNVKTSYDQTTYNKAEPTTQKFSQSVALKDGKNVITVEVADSLGNTVTKTITIYRSTEAVVAEAKTALQKEVDQDKQIKEDTYTTDSFSRFAAALTAAEKTLDNSKATLKDFNDGLSTLQAVKKTLVNKVDAAKKVLQTTIANVEKDYANADNYSKESYAAYTKALEAAKKLVADPKATATELTQATKELTDAAHALKPSVTKQAQEGLDQAVKTAQAKNLNEADYTAASFQAYETALKKAEAVLADKKSTEKDYQAATQALEKAEKALAPSETKQTAEAKTTLQTELDKSKEKQAKDYTDASYQKLVKAQKDAEAVLKQKQPALVDLQKATTALQDALKSLTPKSTVNPSGSDNGDSNSGSGSTSNPTTPAKKKFVHYEVGGKAYSVLVWKQDSTGNFVPTLNFVKSGVGVNTTETKTVNGVEYAKIGDNQWVQTQYLSDQKPAETNQETTLAGIVEVTYQYKVYLRDGNGKIQTQKVSHGQRFKVFAKKIINGKTYYRLGNQQQWIEAQYVKFV